MRLRVHPAVAHMNAIVRNMNDRTGRPLEDWVALVNDSAPVEAKAQMAWLGREHGLGGPTAQIILQAAAGKGEEHRSEAAYLKRAPGLVDALFSGPRAELRPVMEAIVAVAEGLAPEVSAAPCKTYVPLYRARVFAQIRPATRTRVDLGLALKGTKRQLTKALIDTGGLRKGDRITHRMEIFDPTGVDNEIRDWLGEAYALDQ